MDALTQPGARRPDLRRLAARLKRERVGAEQVALIGFTCALLGAAALALSGISVGVWRGGLLVVAALALPLRLVCVRLGTLVAVEEGLTAPAQPIWSGLFDRVADVALLAGTGFAAVIASLTYGPLLGWTCAVLALLAAYVGERGRGLAVGPAEPVALAGSGPLLVLEAGILLSILEPFWRGKGQVLLLGLVVAAVLSLVRLVRLAGRLDRAARATPPIGAPIGATVDAPV